eukprot:TRINITY_DN1947_c0_g1_i2.p1 TRINITY_DN1947_c0_g1~~TRINITY_DN1947_c0_g1_i2.p1  ORF type:complete len:223 (-),score=61.52 TRINITY_DN1947_c0_g1_i2:580-1200(-)
MEAVRCVKNIEKIVEEKSDHPEAFENWIEEKASEDLCELLCFCRLDPFENPEDANDFSKITCDGVKNVFAMLPKALSQSLDIVGIRKALDEAVIDLSEAATSETLSPCSASILEHYVVAIETIQRYCNDCLIMSSDLESSDEEEEEEVEEEVGEEVGRRSQHHLHHLRNQNDVADPKRSLNQKKQLRVQNRAQSHPAEHRENADLV